MNTVLTGYFGGGMYNKETKQFEIKKNMSKNGKLSLGMQYKISSKDMDGNKIYNGIKVKLMLNDKEELSKVEKLIEERCSLEGFFSAVEFEGSDGKVKYIEFVAKVDDLKPLEASVKKEDSVGKQQKEEITPPW